jgi:hypothetical protein
VASLCTSTLNDAEHRATLLVRLAAAGDMLMGASRAEAIAAIGGALLAVTDAPRAAVFFRSPTGAVTCSWSHNLSDAYVRALATPDGVNPWLHIMRHPDLKCMDLPKGRTRTAEPTLVCDIGEWPSVTADLIDQAEREGFRSMCSWPLNDARRVIAALAYYFDAPHVCSEPEQEVMRLFSVQAATLLANGDAARAQNPTDVAGTTANLTKAQAAIDGETTRGSDRWWVPNSAARLIEAPRAS